MPADVSVPEIETLFTHVFDVDKVVLSKSALEGLMDTLIKLSLVLNVSCCLDDTKDLKKPIILGCMYRPTDNNNDYTQDLCNALSDLSARF